MNKAYVRINWENYPSDATPLNESNLNKIDAAMDELDNRIIEQETKKLDKSTANGMVRDVYFDSQTGIFTITYLSGSTVAIDTKLEKLAVNFSYDSTNQRLIITLDDGTEQYVDLSALITEYEFIDSATLAFSVGVDGKITAKIKSGSISGDMLEPNYLANIQTAAGLAQGAADSATLSASAAKESEQSATVSEEMSIQKAAEASASEASAAASEQAATVAKNSAEAACETALNAKNTAAESAIQASTSAATAIKKAEAASVSQESASNSAQIAEQNANTATDKSILAESFARGGTGTRAGEDTDNAYFYMQQAKAQSGGIPTKLSELINDMDFVTSMTQALAYYYKSSQVYTKEEVDGKISAIPKFSIVAIDSFPTENISETTIYLLKEGTTGTNKCSEWVYINGSWEKLGDIDIDLTGYLTKNGDGSNLTETFGQAAELTNIATGEEHSTIFGKVAKAISALISHVTTAATSSVLGHVKVDTAMSSASTNPVQNKAIYTALAGKLSTSGDGSNVTVTYTESTSLSNIFTGEKMSVMFGKIKKAISTIVSLNTKIGASDISGIGDGTVTGGIYSLNNNLVANIYVGDDGKLHKVQGGADSVLPFSSLLDTIYYKTGGSYITGIWDTRNATKIKVKATIPPTNALYVMGGDNIDFDTSTGNALNGTQILYITDSLEHEIDVSNYDYVALEFYSIEQPYNQRYYGWGTASVSGMQLVKLKS